MKSSKSFLLLAMITVLIIAVSACAVIPSQTNAAGVGGISTMTATVNAIDGDKLTLSMHSSPSGLGGNIFQGVNGSYNFAYATISGNAYASIASFSYAFNFSDMSLSTNFYTNKFDSVSGVHYYYYVSGAITKTFTVAPEMLEGISVGDVVEITLDANENIMRITKSDSSNKNEAKETTEAIAGDKDIAETTETLTAKTEADKAEE